MNIPNVRAPEPLAADVTNGNPSANWVRWKQRFSIYLKAIGCGGTSGEQKVGLLLNHIGDSAVDVYENFTYLAGGTDADGNVTEAESPDDYELVLKKFDEHFCRRDPQLMLREHFWLKLKREPGQSMDNWVNTVKKHATECKFPPSFLQEAIRDKLTFCSDDHSKLKLYDVGATLTIDKAVDILSLREATRKELDSTKASTIDRVQSTVGQRPKTHAYPRCDKCDRPHKPQYCPASKARCRKCDRIGHYAVMCTAKPAVREVASQDFEDCQTNDSVFIGSIDSGKTKPGWYVNLDCSKKRLCWCIDTGAEVSVMPEGVFQTLEGNLPLEKPDKVLLGTGNSKLDTLGYIDVKLSSSEMTIVERVYVVKNAMGLLLGFPAIRKLGILDKIPGTILLRDVTIKAVDLSASTGVPTLTQDAVEKAFPKLFQGLGRLDGEYDICLKDDIQPFCQLSPRRVPLPLQDKVKANLDEMVKLGVIEPIDEATDWCSPIVVVPKSNGDVRICVDLTKLNVAVKREVYQIPKVEETLAKLSQGSVFSKLDANCGFHQVVLSEASARLTTFITGSGRYFFRRLPYGICSAPEYFQRRMDQELQGLEGVVCHMDDILIFGSSQQEHNERLLAVLRRLSQSGLTLNKKKCQFSKQKLEYLGQVIEAQGVRKDPVKIKSIVDAEAPCNVSELRRFLGMVNQQMKFTPNLSDLTDPLRELLKSRSAWSWDQNHDLAFSRLKEEMASDRVLALYSTTRDTVVSADASSYGLGACLLQRQEDGDFKPVAYASRSMTETERHYAQIEKEALAVTWAVEHWSDLLLGLHFKVETDHKPLVPLFSSKLIDDLPIRVQRFRMRLMRYAFDIVHVSGKMLVTADTLSRTPFTKDSADESKVDFHDLSDEVEAYLNAVMVSLPASDKRLDEIRREIRHNDTLRTVVQCVVDGWDKTSICGPMKKFFPERYSLSYHDGLLMKGRRLVIPLRLQPDVLRHLHDCHQGVSKMRANAMCSVWWPGLSRDIEKMVQSCHECQKFRRRRIEPMKGTEYPVRPWSRVGVDFFEHKQKMYLLAVDYYSRDVEVCIVSRTVNTPELIGRLKKVFSRHGVPDVLFSDNGPQFASAEFRSFSEAWRFEHIRSSPRYPQANGEAERAVETVKGILDKCNDEYLALMVYRDTPLHNGYSPAQLSMGRRLKTLTPVHPEALLPELPDPVLLRKRESEYRRKMSCNYDKRHNVVEAEALTRGDNVWIPDMKTQGTVVDFQDPRSVIISKSDGSGDLRRNRSHVRRLDPPSPSAEAPVEIPVLAPDVPLAQPLEQEERPEKDPPRRSTRIRSTPKRLIEAMD